MNILNKLIIINVLTSEYCDLQLIDLIILKTQSGLSNKKWDKTIKSLTKHGVVLVNKTDDGLMVEVIQYLICQINEFENIKFVIKL